LIRPAAHLELLVEEPSMETFLRALLPRLLPHDRTFEVHPFEGKIDLLGKLEARLRGYAAWLPADWRIVVVVDRDDDDCRTLKRQLESMARRAGLRTRARHAQWQLVNRIAIEELEAWYFGDWAAVRAVYPRVPASIPYRSSFRNPDAIAGGTWEAFERVLQRHGYFQGGLAKLEAARGIGAKMDPSRSQSSSFVAFCRAIAEAMA
jgi:hypothetical protein